jgi:DNA-binding CsgD family transcriptional regulator/Arc/MetJ family transcription regulator
VRQYAQEKLGESGEAEAVRSRHRDHYSSMAALLDAPARNDFRRSVEQADDEMDNLRSAFGWSIETGDIALALKLASSLMPLWLSRSRIQEGLAWFDVVLADGISRLDGLASHVRARVLADKTVLDAWVNTYNVEYASEALTIARELDDPALLVRALLACGSAAVYDADVADRYFSEATGLARALEDKWRLSQILAQQAQAALVTGNPIALRPPAEEGHEIANTIGDRFGSRQCGWRLATARILMGDLAGGIALLRDVLAEAEAEHDGISLVTALLILPQALAYQGDACAARAAAEGAVESATELGDVYIGAVHIELMIAHLAAGDVALASEAAETAWSHLKNLQGTAQLNSGLIAQAALASGDLASARRKVDDALPTASGWNLASALTTRARIAVAENDSERAEQDAHHALACCAGVGAYLGLSDILEILAGLAGETGSSNEAGRLFGAAEAIRRRTGEVRFAVHQAAYDSSVLQLRNAISASDFETAWNEGAALSTTEAIAYAQRGRGERRRPSSGWASLTPAELDVVRLVSEGLGNKDIAARLFVSPRTVQSHLTRVYTKLGLTSRVQLAQEATRRSATTNG